ncbi:hypothetical protein TEA_008034 [Camellia sinensis var. sinensis]|uniref:Isopenicillin N synthase-like Fe(2+) 2OG dioxygenase domain-containing protein n=1 Tax=Camellia sinensis var. sinensis TaxID=542762 RepID=A0A4S4DP48_CAMSN|nr:hypothetical protein TEA_008034 [Camellia sinensis var. sinensis]
MDSPAQWQICKYGVYIPFLAHYGSITRTPIRILLHSGRYVNTMVTNGIYKSIEHRATVNSEKERLSVATFLGANLELDVGPAPSLITSQTPAIFRRVNVTDYLKAFLACELRGKSCIDVMRIQNEEAKPPRDSYISVTGQSGAIYSASAPQLVNSYDRNLIYVVFVSTWATVPVGLVTVSFLELSIMKHDGLEECNSNKICSSGVEGTIPKECYREKEGIRMMEVNTVVEELKCDGVFSGEEEACSKEVEQRIGPSDCHLGEEVNTVVKETMMEESVHSPKINVEQAFTPGFPKSFSGSRVGHGHGINIEVDLAQALSMNLNGKGFLSLNHSGLGKQPASVPKLLQNDKKKRKKKVQLEGFTSFTRLHGHKAAAVSKHSSKSIIFRLATAAIARSDLSEGVTSLSNLLLNEAKPTLQLGKSLGINFNGKEEDVLNKIIELELQDKERSK